MEAANVIEQESDFTEAQLETLKALPYKRPFLERLLSERMNLQDGFHRFLLKAAFAESVAFSAIMVEFGGRPLGVEFKSEKREAWAFVLRDAGEADKFRVQYFDQDGFTSHYTRDTLHECVDAMVSEGYRVKDVGALDRASLTPRWNRGTEVAGLLQKLNSRKITFAQFNEMCAALS